VIKDGMLLAVIASMLAPLAQTSGFLGVMTVAPTSSCLPETSESKDSWSATFQI